MHPEGPQELFSRTNIIHFVDTLGAINMDSSISNSGPFRSLVKGLELGPFRSLVKGRHREPLQFVFSAFRLHKTHGLANLISTRASILPARCSH